jgi:hypothetical protein
LDERFEAEFLAEYTHEGESRVGHEVLVIECHQQTRRTE